MSPFGKGLSSSGAENDPILSISKFQIAALFVMWLCYLIMFCSCSSNSAEPAMTRHLPPIAPPCCDSESCDSLVEDRGHSGLSVGHPPSFGASIGVDAVKHSGNDSAFEVVLVAPKWGAYTCGGGANRAAPYRHHQNVTGWPNTMGMVCGMAIGTAVCACSCGPTELHGDALLGLGKRMLEPAGRGATWKLGWAAVPDGRG